MERLISIVKCFLYFSVEVDKGIITYVCEVDSTLVT